MPLRVNSKGYQVVRNIDSPFDWAERQLLTRFVYSSIVMFYGYLFASILAGWLSFHYGAMAVPVWIAGTASFLITCLMIFIGIVRNELPRDGSRNEWLHAGAIERRAKGAHWAEHRTRGHRRGDPD